VFLGVADLQCVPAGLVLWSETGGITLMEGGPCKRAGPPRGIGTYNVERSQLCFSRFVNLSRQKSISQSFL
jgi:hypothetical protein